MFLATLSSQDVASFSFPFVPSSKLKFFKEGGVMDSVSGIFRAQTLWLTEKLRFMFSLCWGHGPESEVMLLSFFLGVNTSGSFLGLDFPSLVGFFHSLNFSVCFSVSSTNVWLPVLVLTFTTRSMASSGRSHVKNPFLKLHLEFRDLAMFSKIYRTQYYCILFNFGLRCLVIVICNAKFSRFQV